MDGLSPMELVICVVPVVFVIIIAIIVVNAIRPKPTKMTAANSQAIAQKDTQTSNSIGDAIGTNAPAEITTNSQNGLAITSLIIGILAIVIHFLFGPVWSNCMGPLAMLTGAISLLQIKKQGSKGKGVAITGIVLGTLPFIITLVTIFTILLSSATNFEK